MDKVKSSTLSKERIKKAKKENGKTLVLLDDGVWYELEQDIIQLDASGGSLMNYINSIIEKE